MLVWGRALPNGLAYAGSEELKRRLLDLGYTDLGFASTDGTVLITFTNQTHRRLAIAIGEILAVAAQEHPSAETYKLIPQTERVPIGSIEVDRRTYGDWCTGKLSDGDFAASLRIRHGPLEIPERTASSQWLSDLSVLPAYSLEGGLAIGLQAQLHTVLADGFSLSAIAQQSVFKIGADLPPAPILSFAYVRWIGSSVPMLMRIGHMGRFGLGGQAEIGIPLRVAELRLIAGGAERGSPEMIARLNTRPGFLNLAFRAGIGRFLDGDWGYEASVIRSFTRSSLEGSLLNTSHGLDIRMVLTLHLGGQKRPMPGHVRFEPGTWSIQYQPESFSIGRTFLPTDELDSFWQDFFLDEISTRLATWPKVPMCKQDKP